MNNDQPIGTVTIEYSETGTVIKANFTPTIQVEANKYLLEELEVLRSAGGSKALQESADLIMASWFSKANEIELADRDLWSIESDIRECQTYPDGGVKKCVLDYAFRKRA